VRQWVVILCKADAKKLGALTRGDSPGLRRGGADAETAIEAVIGVELGRIKA
jgi:hypothetical protein